MFFLKGLALGILFSMLGKISEFVRGNDLDDDMVSTRIKE